MSARPARPRGALAPRHDTTLQVCPQAERPSTGSSASSSPTSVLVECVSVFLEARRHAQETLQTCQMRRMLPCRRPQLIPSKWQTRGRGVEEWG